MFNEATITTSLSFFFFSTPIMQTRDKWVTCADAFLRVITPIKAFPDTVFRPRLVSDPYFMETQPSVDSQDAPTLPPPPCPLAPTP